MHANGDSTNTTKIKFHALLLNNAYRVPFSLHDRRPGLEPELEFNPEAANNLMT